MKQTLLIGVLLLGFNINSQVNLTSGLTACYALNGNGNEPVNNLTGILSSVTPTADRFNNANSAMYFSGTVGSIIKLPASPLLKPSNNVSFSLWVKPDALSTMEVIHTTNIYSYNFSAYALTFQPAGTGYVFRGYRQNGPQGSNIVSATTAVTSPGNWYHVVFTIDNVNSQMKMYVNGVLENTAACTITNYNYQPGKEVILGGTNEPQIDPPFKGSMDNLRFYNRVINASEVSALYTQDPSCIVSGSPPNSAFTASSNTICARDTVFLNDMSTNNPTSWAWTMNGGAPATATISNPFVIYNLTGTYTISLIATNQFGQSNTSYQTINVLDCIDAGITPHNDKSFVKIFPNPNSDKLFLTCEDNINYLWELTDAIGRKVSQGVATGQQTIEIDISQEKKGLYFLRTISKSNQSVTKIIKE